MQNVSWMILIICMLSWTLVFSGVQIIFSIAAVPNFPGLRRFPEVGISSNGPEMIRKPLWRFVSNSRKQHNTYNDYVTDLHSSNHRLCSWCYGWVYHNLHGFLLSSTTLKSRPWLSGYDGSCPCTISSLSTDLWNWGCSTRWILVASITVTLSLRSSHQAVWLSEWAMLLHHRFKTHCCSQETLASIEQEQPPTTDSCNKHSLEQARCSACQVMCTLHAETRRPQNGKDRIRIRGFG